MAGILAGSLTGCAGMEEHPIDISDEATMKRLTSLLDAGIRTIVDLTEEREKIPSYSSLLHLIATDRQIDVAIHRFSITDRGVPSAKASNPSSM